MRFREFISREIGVRGIVPDGWPSTGDGTVARKASPEDPNRLAQRVLPQADIDSVLAFLSRQIGLESLPASTGRITTSQASWELFTFDAILPDLGDVVIDCMLAQEGTWVYLVFMMTTPAEHDLLHESIFLPVVHAFVPLTGEFGLINGGQLTSDDSPTLTSQLGYSSDSVLVIVHADDMAAHRDQTDGALDAMAVGMCKTGSVMVPCPDFERTVSIWKQHPELDLGIHLTLNSEWGARYGWGGVLPQGQVPSLYNPDGIFWGTEQELREHMVVGEAMAEMEAQITHVLDAGVKPTHMDDHMGCYWQHPELKRGAIQLSKKYSLPMNPIDIPEMRQQGYICADAVWMFIFNILLDTVNPSVRMKVYDDWMRRLKPGVHLLLTHISRMSDDYRSKIPAPFFREGDYAYWTSAKTQALSNELGITFIGYRELQRLHAGK